MRYGVESRLDSEYTGVEQWKVDYLERQKNQRQAGVTH